MSKIILHIDLNKFFVRCEEIKNPSLIDKPVAVGGDGRKGIVSTCSYEARNYGIKSGMPMFQAKMLCKNLIILPGDYEYYELMSKEFINVVMKYSKKIEQMSCDECFVDVSEQYPTIRKVGITNYLKKFQEELYAKTKLNCSIGVAPTKFLAKMGSDYKKPNGITIIRKKDIPTIIFPLPISDLFGVGRKTYPKLEKLGFKTIGDLYNGLITDDSRLEGFFGSYRQDIINELEGNSDDNVSNSMSDPKSIGMTRTLDFDTNDKAYLEKFLENLIKGVYSEFNKKDMLAKTIQLTYKDAQYEGSFQTKTVSKSFDEYTNNFDIIHDTAIKLFKETYKGNELRLIGFTLKNLSAKHDLNVQMTFDNYENYEKDNKTGLLINELNRQLKSEKFFRLSDLKKNKEH